MCGLVCVWLDIGGKRRRSIRKRGGKGNKQKTKTVQESRRETVCYTDEGSRQTTMVARD